MQGAAPGVRSVLSGAPGGRHIWSCNHVDGVRVDPGRRFGQRFATLWPWDSRDLETRHTPAAAPAPETSLKHLFGSRWPFTGRRSPTASASSTGIGKINRRCRKSWSRQQAGCRRRLAPTLSERQGEARKCRSRRSAGLLLHSDDNRFPGPHPKGTDPRKTNTNRMVILAKGLKARQAGEYSGSMKRTPSMKVAETPWFRRRAPPAACSWPSKAMKRIDKTPQDTDATEVLRFPLRDHCVGSGRQREEGRETGDQWRRQTTPCGMCHVRIYAAGARFRG